MNSNPYESPHTPGESPARGIGMLIRPLLKWLAVVGVIGLVIALLLPAVRSSREPSRRSQCTNNLKQIALALHDYESVYHSFPPAYTVDAEGKPLHSWRTLILPYLDSQQLYDKIDLSKAWDDPANEAASQVIPGVYRCPSATYPERHTAYLAVVAPSGCFGPTEPRRLSEITDAPGLTLMVIEVDSDHAVPWMSPTDASEETILNLGTAEKRPHPRGFQAAMADGSVYLLPADMKGATLRALISIDGDDDEVAQKID